MYKVILRPFIPDSDTGFILDTFPKSVYYGKKLVTTKSKKEWFEDFHVYTLALLDISKIYVACSSEDLNHILGYSIVHQMPAADRLEFVFVKPHVRKQSIGSMLIFRKYTVINHNNLTKLGLAILKKHPELLGDEHDPDSNPEENADSE